MKAYTKQHQAAFAGKYSAVRGFAHAVCKSELEDCTDNDRPDPAVAEAGTRSVNAEL